MNLPARSALVALLLVSTASLPAQQAANPPPPRDPNVITIDFPGGPLSKLVGALERDATRLSIIQSAGLDPVLPAFSVRNARLDGVVIALGQLLEPQGYHLIPTGENLAVLRKIEKNAPADRRQFAVLALEKRLGRQPADVIIKAIQSGCEFASEDKSSLRFQYHEATKLLFVSGAARDIEVAHKIFASLPEHPAGAAEPAPEPRK